MQPERDMEGLSNNNNHLLHQQQQPLQPPPQQKCPRCDSLHTKFCYYNNYSLSQPRYFCKGCRRYWTHGGTLRNIPVGGGCRKGKRGKTAAAMAMPPLPSMRMVPPTVQVHQPAQVVHNPYYQSGVGNGGFYSSLSGMSFTHPVNHQIGGEFRSMSSNIGLLQGFSLPSYGSSQQIYQMGNNGGSKNMMIQTTSTLNQEWSLLNPSTSSDGGVSWNINDGSSGVADIGNNIGSFSLSPSPWNDHFSRYDPPNL